MCFNDIISMYNKEFLAELCEIIRNVLFTVCGENEVIYDDLDNYREFVQLMGHEPMAAELFPQVDAGGRLVEISGMCCAGEGWQMTKEILRRQGISEEIISVMDGKLYYKSDAIARSVFEVLDLFGIPSAAGRFVKKLAVRLTLACVAHERRHAVQPAQLYDFDKQYLLARHEQDAYEVTALMLKRRITLSEATTVATSIWDPAEER